MATGAQTWSTAAASNNSADGAVNWAEGMAPSAVNNSARAEMASAAMYIKDNNGSLLTTGTTAAYTVTSKQGSTAATDGYTIAVNFHATNDTSATLNVDSIGAKNLQQISGTNVSGGEFRGGTTHRFRYSSSSTAWVEVSPTLLRDLTAGTILGNGSTSAAAPTELTIGAGLVATTSSISAPAFPPSAAFKNLSIKVTGNSSATIAADFVTLATSGSSVFSTLPVASNINLGANGADGLDSGSLDAKTWYAVYAIATATSTAAQGLASTSFSTPTMPSTGYIYKARIGAIVTSSSTAGTLMGTWQYGRRAQYVPGLAATSHVPILSTGTAGNTTTPTWSTVSTTNYVPSTSSRIFGNAGVSNNGTGSALVAPSTNYGGITTTSNPSPVMVVTVSQTMFVPFDFMLESSNINYASGGVGGIVSCLGWEDNL